MLSVATGDDLDKIAHLRAEGRLHTQAWVRKRMPPSVRDCGGRAAAKVYGRVKAGNIAAACASRRYRPSPPSARRHSRAGGRAQTVGCARRYTDRRSAVNGGARICMRSLFLHSVIASISLGAGVRTCGYARRRTFSAVRRGFAVRRPLFCAGKRVKACKFVEKYRANRRACLTFHGNLCTIIKMEIFCPHEPCGRL